MSTVTEEPTRRAAVVAAGAGAVGWLLVHFQLVLPAEWWAAAFEGEWDILLPALAMADGDSVRVATGSIHGFEVGSYLVARAAGGLIQLGLEPTLASRYLAAAVGATGAAGVTGGATALLAGRSRVEMGCGALAAWTAVTFMWPHWHFQNVGVTGTSLEASVLLATFFLAASAPQTPWRARGLGAILAAALLFSSLALAALPAAALIVAARPRISARRLVEGALIPLVPCTLLPGGPTALVNIGWSWWGAPSQALANSPGADLGWSPLRAFTLLAPADLYSGPWAAASAAGSVLIVAAVLLTLTRSAPATPLRRVGGAALYCLLVLALVPRTAADGHEVARYWSVYLLLGATCLGALPAVLPRRWGPLPLVLVVGLAGTAIAFDSSPLPPPGRSVTEVFTTLGSHRTPERLGGREGISDRHGTFIDLAPRVPAPLRAAFAQGYGIAIAEDLATPGMIAWWPEWDLETLRPHVRAMDWQDFLFGLGCGHAILPRVDADRLELLRSLTDADSPSYGLGFGWCGTHGPGVTKPWGGIEEAASACASFGRRAGPRLGLDLRGSGAAACTATVRPAVPDLWTYLRP